MGGPQMRAAGIDIITDYSEVSVIGITEILSHLPSLIRAMRKLVGAAEQRKPALAILTDFPGFPISASPANSNGAACATLTTSAAILGLATMARSRSSAADSPFDVCSSPSKIKFYADAGVPPQNSSATHSSATSRRPLVAPRSPRRSSISIPKNPPSRFFPH